MLASAYEALQKREVEVAIQLFDQSQKAGFDPKECAGGRWKCWMLLGEFEKAWRESDFIAPFTQRWEGKRVMLRCLHGLGDTIQFIRYAPLLRRNCTFLSVQVHPELVRLIQHVPGVDHVFGWSEDPFPWDMQMEVTELPYAFRTAQQTIPAEVPYIRLERGTAKGKVGVNWQSSSYDPSRSIPGFELEGCQSLNLRDLDVPDVLGTAELMMDMDLIITVDTMTAHLAGALGLPVWILLPYAADWRWMLGRDDSPWYPTARLFRQKRPGDWSGVLEEVSGLFSSYGSCNPLKGNYQACKAL